MRGKVLAVVLALVVVAGAAYAIVRFRAPADDAAVALVPEDAVVYVNVFLSPSTAQKQALESLLERLGVAPTVEEAKSKLVELIDDALAGSGLRYEEDIEPWLGDQAALFVAEFHRPVPEIAALVATDDENATRALVEGIGEAADEAPRAESYEGTDYLYYPGEEVASGFVDGFWVVGTEPGFRAVVDTAAGGDSFAEGDRYRAVRERLADDVLALYYFDLGTVFTAVERSAALGMPPDERELLEALDLDELGPAAGALSLASDRVVLEAANVIPRGHVLREMVAFEDAPVAGLPSGSWAALGVPDAGSLVARMLDLAARFDPGGEIESAERAFAAETGLDLRADVLSWIGDVGAFARGTGLLNLGGGVVIESDYPWAARRTLDALAALAVRAGASVRADRVAGADGYALQEEGMPDAVYAVVGDDRVVVAYGRTATADALAGGTRLAASDAFARARRALGEGFSPALYLDMDMLVRFVDGIAGDDDAYRDRVKPWLDPLTHVIGGSRLDGDVVLQRIVIGVE